MSAISSNRGFTLLEVLIAMVLLAVLATALYGSYFTVVRARERAAEGMEARRELGSTCEHLSREISSAVFDSRDKQRLRFVVEDRDNYGKAASSLELTTLTPPYGVLHPESGIIVVKYQILEKNKQMILTRRENDMFYSDAEAPKYPQMEHISSFLVECDDGAKWVKSWDTALNGKLPTRVRITIRFEEGGKLEEFQLNAKPRITL